MADKTPSKTPASDKAERVTKAARALQDQRQLLVAVCTAHQITQSNFTQDHEWEARDEFVSRVLHGLEHVIDDYAMKHEVALEKYKDAQHD